MKRILMVGLVFAACGPEAKFNSACDKIGSRVCGHQVECDIEQELVLCLREWEEDYICDPDATLEELEVCADAALTLECERSVPFVCFDILCDAERGCDEPVVPTTPDTGDTSPVSP